MEKGTEGKRQLESAGEAGDLSESTLGALYQSDLLSSVVNAGQSRGNATCVALR